jgi:hypothetical protein
MALVSILLEEDKRFIRHTPTCGFCRQGDHAACIRLSPRVTIRTRTGDLEHLPCRCPHARSSHPEDKV